jgi:hypothetical protein
MSFLSSIPVIGSFFNDIGEAIDKNVTSDEERLKIKADMLGITAPVIQAVVQAQISSNELQAKIVEMESKSEDRMVRWRRPLLSFAAAINFFSMLWMWIVFGPGIENIWAIEDIPAVVQYSFTFAALVNGLDIGTRGVEKMVGSWANGKNGNGKNGH